MNRLPRNVKNYRVQDIDCKHRYLGMTDGLSCKKACSTPETPCWCDHVDTLGICDEYEIDEWDERAKGKVL